MRDLGCEELTKQVAMFLEFKRALGCQYVSGKHMMRRFEFFAIRHAGRRRRIDLRTAIHAWLEKGPDRKPVTLAKELGVLRQFCLYLRRGDPATYVPPVSLAPIVKPQYVPYLLSIEEVRRLINGAVVEKFKNSAFWTEALHMLLIAVYCTGLRLGEAVRLQLFDLDEAKRILHIHESKGRSRDLPFQADLAREFAGYLRKRADLLRNAGRVHEAALFVNLRGQAITVDTASKAIRRLLRRLGMKSKNGRTGPRPYDMRHAFAVHRLTAWYKEGVNLQERIPWLSAYMGHLDLLGTEVYLHATPELLGAASRRFSDRFSEAGEKR
jgi:integrase/recombinase XerD